MRSTPNWHSIWLLRVVLLSALVPGFAQDSGLRKQELGLYMDRTYGPDQALINGLQFYNRYLGCSGHPYLQDDRFRNGSVTIRGREYAGLKLKYDLVEQELVVRYQDEAGRNNLVVTVPDHVEAFQLERVVFRRMELEDGASRFYQLIRTGQFDCYVYWAKKRVRINGNTRYHEKCTEASRNFLISVDGSIFRFSNRRGFLHSFPRDARKELRKMFRFRNVRLGKGNPEEIVEWMMMASDTLEGSEYL